MKVRAVAALAPGKPLEVATVDLDGLTRAGQNIRSVFVH
jgi:hypothetical protein